MIKYQLVCAKGHAFEAWFANSAAFDTLAKRKALRCETCGSKAVTKSMMAPSVAKHEVSALEARRAVKELVTRMKAGADDVGPRFAEEARAMHEGDTPQRGIYGEATVAEARELIEDGISVLPLPSLPDEQN
jgi:hypothetical protein